jgi:membrane-associated phospholipid phosphatase
MRSLAPPERASFVRWRAWFERAVVAIAIAGASAFAGQAKAQATAPPAEAPDKPPAAARAPEQKPSAATGETADPPRRLRWRWSRFNVADYVFTGAIALTYLYLEFAVETPSEPNWRGGVLVDDDVRDAMVAETRASRERAGVISDFLTLAPQALAIVDASLVPLATDDWNWDVMWQMTAINLQVIAVTGLLSRGGHRLVARERPDVAPCQDDAGYHGLCFGGPNASFPSGHTSAAFAGAALVCSHHMKLPLYGGGAAETAVCVGSLTMAAGSGVLRLTADRHYLSDVVVGAGIGAAAGFGLPLLLHYRGGESAKAGSEHADPNKLRVTLAPLPLAGGFGASAYGWF